MTGAERSLRIGQACAIVAVVIGAVLTSSAEQWEPWGLVLALFAVLVLSDAFAVKIKSIWISGASMTLAGAMILLGPAPAVAIGVISQILDLGRRRPGWGATLTNLSTYAVFPFLGGLAAVWVGAELLAAQSDWLAMPVVVAVFLASNVLNFFGIAVDVAVVDRVPVRRSLKEVYLPILPADIVMAILTAAAVLGYYVLGSGAIAMLAIIALSFQYLMRSVWESDQRGEALEKRTRELSALQVGLLSTVLQTLSLRDAMTARHSAAVARYAREMARELGLDEDEQDLIHTAGLLHDIGKFIFPDSILFAARRLTDDEFNIVRRHPEQGARLVARIEGYGPVAEIIRAHHERIDGKGYPRRLPGDQIPLGSRMISIADTYDVMTSRDSYRDPVSSEEAVAELRRVSGTQLDGDLVELFIKILESRDIRFRHADDADFEAELSFEKRVRAYAEPRVSA